MYDYDVGQASMRLGRTIVMYDGVPVYVADAKGRGKNVFLQCYELPNMRVETLVNIKDPKLDFLNFKLGYVNVGAQAHYLRRIPGRQQRQGLCRTNVSSSTGTDFERLYSNPEFVDAFAGKYYDFNEARKLIDEKKRKSVAISRHFALAQDDELGFYELHYKGARVCYGDPENLTLPSHLTYLTEAIKEQGVRIR